MVKIIFLSNKEKKKSLLEFAGIWKDKPDMDKIFKEISNERYNSNNRKIYL